MEEENILEFVETIDGKEYGHFRILLQEYWEYADKDDDEGKPIYNVAIEYAEDAIWSSTLDIFESYSLSKTKKYYDTIIKNIEKTNGIREENI